MPVSRAIRRAPRRCWRASARCWRPLALAVIAVTILATSFISGIFGMAGGLILLGVLLVFMDVAPAMVLFGAIQTAANGWRATLGCATSTGASCGATWSARR